MYYNTLQTLPFDFESYFSLKLLSLNSVQLMLQAYWDKPIVTDQPHPFT